MNTLEILTKARDLISDPARWTQKAFARDNSGESINNRSSYAVCWCAMGAVYKTSSNNRASVPFSFLHAAAGMWAGNFNDTHTHAEVLAVFDKAIEAAKETQS